jgi:hypothetical protein
MILLDQAGAGASESRFFPPLRIQESFIENFWIQQTRSSPVGRAWRIIPDANPYLIFVVSREDSGVQERCFLVGPRSRFADVTMDGRILTCGVRFRPGALPLLTRFSASAFTDRSVLIDDVFGADGKLLTAQLRESRSPIAAVSRISDFLSYKWMSHNRILRLPLGEFTRVEDMPRRPLQIPPPVARSKSPT